MAILVIWSVLLGAVLGRFFKVLVLVPACALVLAAVLVRSANVEHGLLRPLLEFGVLITSLQIGYACGLFSFLIPSVSQRPKETPARASSVPPIAVAVASAPVMPRRGPRATGA